MIDAEATKKAADEILSQYREARGLAEMPINPPMTQGWGDGSPHSTANRPTYSEQHVIEQEQAQKLIEWLDAAIKAVPKDRLRKLLIARYCEGWESDHPDQDAIGKLDTSSTAYFRNKNKALLLVAKPLHKLVFIDAGQHKA